MTSIKHTLALALALALFAGCSRDEAPKPAAPVAPPAATTVDPLAEPPPTPEPGEVPVEVRADAIAAGHVLGPNGAVSEAKSVYAIGDTVYASMPIRGQKAGSEIGVYWTYQDGTTHKEETKPLPPGAQFVNFAFSKSDGMRAGNYNVQIDVDFKPIGIVDFKVK